MKVSRDRYREAKSYEVIVENNKAGSMNEVAGREAPRVEPQMFVSLTT